jgi:hypothetical protein
MGHRDSVSSCKKPKQYHVELPRVCDHATCTLWHATLECEHLSLQYDLGLAVHPHCACSPPLLECSCCEGINQSTVAIPRKCKPLSLSREFQPRELVCHQQKNPNEEIPACIPIDALQP